MLIKHINPKNPKQFVGAHKAAAVEWPDGGISYGPDYKHTPKKLLKDEAIAGVPADKPVSAKKAPAKKAAKKSTGGK